MCDLGIKDYNTFHSISLTKHLNLLHGLSKCKTTFLWTSQVYHAPRILSVCINKTAAVKPNICCVFH